MSNNAQIVHLSLRAISPAKEYQHEYIVDYTFEQHQKDNLKLL